MRAPTLLCAGLGLVLAGPVVAFAADTGPHALLAAPDHGAAAVAGLGEDLDVAAARSGLTGSQLRRVLDSDRTAWVDRDGRLFYVEPAPDADAASAPATDAAAFPYDQTFLLHSRPIATRVIYLDFDGLDLHDTAWNDAGTPALTVPAYTRDDDPAFSTAELDVAQEVWARVAEDYAPFNIDVTTQDPGSAGLVRSSAEDAAYGVRASITTQTTLRSAITGCGGSCAGVAYIGQYDTVLPIGPTQEYYQPAFVLPTRTYSAAFVAEIVSHELGHTLGLAHDGLGAAPYYQDTDGTKIWSPIMGAGYTPLTQFSNGDYAGATNTQDDYAVISANGPSVVGDDYGDDTASAYQLGGGAVAATGLVTSRTDVDAFRITRSCTGTVTATVTPAALGPGLDTRLQLLDAAGTVVATSAPPTARGGTWSPVLTGMGATMNHAVGPGTYYFLVDGVGLADPVLGYSDYGGVGRYGLDASGCPGDVHAATAPSAPVVIAAERDTAAHGLRLVWDPPAADGGSPVTGYTLTVNGGSPVTVPPGGRSHTFADLAPQTSYTLGVAATNAVGPGPTATRAATTGSFSGTSTPTPTPTPTPTTTATPTMTPSPTASPTVQPTSSPTSSATAAPTSTPTVEIAILGAPWIKKLAPGPSGGAKTLTVTWKAPMVLGTFVTKYRVTLWRVRGSVPTRQRKYDLPATARRLRMVLKDARYAVSVKARAESSWGPKSARSLVVRAR